MCTVSWLKYASTYSQRGVAAGRGIPRALAGQRQEVRRICSLLLGCCSASGVVYGCLLRTRSQNTVLFYQFVVCYFGSLRVVVFYAISGARLYVHSYKRASNFECVFQGCRNFYIYSICFWRLQWSFGLSSVRSDAVVAQERMFLHVSWQGFRILL